METLDTDKLLPEIDREFLQAKGYEHDVIPWQGGLHLVIRDYPFPAAYNPRITNLLVQLPAGFPNAALDMFWTSPHVQLSSGGRPVATDHRAVQHDGNEWQRWSRHIQWRAGVDDLRSFLAAIRREIDKGI
jgi:hypothetical protein